VIELYRVRCPDCGVKTEKVPQLPSKAPFSKRFEEAVGLACEKRGCAPGGPAVWVVAEHRTGHGTCQENCVSIYKKFSCGFLKA
jgi:hypothetical protein